MTNLILFEWNRSIDQTNCAIANRVLSLVVDIMADFQVVPTKLNRPDIDRRWIVRPRLLSALDDALSSKLTLISAPAGYGKTTLAAQWLDHIPHPSAWLSLDEHDSDPDRFLRYVVASIRKIFPQFGSQIEQLLFSPTLPPPRYLADMLISDLDALNETLILALDDFHTIASEPVQKMTTRLVQYLPERHHLVIATRMDPPLPLAKWRLRKWLAEFRGVDLRFFPEEAKAYFASPVKGQLSNDSIERIIARTEGWIAGLQLARLSVAVADNPDAFARSFSGSDRMVAKFLMDEVISRQSDEIKHFFAVTFMLERFCAPLCNHLLGKKSGIPDSRRLIALLQKENLFLVPLDSEGIWYRYHHLFQALLVSRMKTDLSQSRQNQIHHSAGEWFADRGQIEDALRHLITAGDLDAAAELVEQNMHAAIDHDPSRRILGRWLEMFPKGAEKQRPALLVAEYYLKMIHWDFISMKLLLDQAEVLLGDSAFPIKETRRLKLLGDIDLQRMYFFYWRGDAEAALRYARRSLSVIPKEHSYAHTLAIFYKALAQNLNGQRDEALQLLAQALAEDCAEGSRNAGVLLVAQTGIRYYAGDMNATEETAKRILSVHETVPTPVYWYAYAHYFLACSAYEHNLLDTAAEHFGQIEQMRYSISTRLYQEALIGLALVAWAKGETGRAKEYAVAASSFAIEMSDPYSMHISNSFQTRMTIFSGNVRDDPAETPPHEVDSNKVWLEIPSLTRAEYQVYQSTTAECEDALRSVEEGLKQAKQHHNTRQVIQFLAVKAAALKCAGRLNEALETLEKVLHVAEPLGFVRTFLDRGPLMAELLQALSAKRPENLYARSLLESFGEKIPTKHTDANAAEYPSRTESAHEALLSSGLSRRELDVLRLLSKRLTNREIAEMLFVSPLTVKTHTANIYRKLNVNNRRQAVARAEQLGITFSNHT